MSERHDDRMLADRLQAFRDSHCDTAKSSEGWVSDVGLRPISDIAWLSADRRQLVEMLDQAIAALRSTAPIVPANGASKPYVWPTYSWGKQGS